ncbi:unnamed protein product [Cyprideis torosa]|uniref:Uncharacterized protein n=1 Tax=Cyprideis torosa TaxID=163714 RepID=A0A7R8W1T5_9CRUS|nr:unnamed protein product [Cyprideis torosa]CAG0880178.1 unnamed protein product [Cyprideis torosa]
MLTDTSSATFVFNQEERISQYYTGSIILVLNISEKDVTAVVVRWADLQHCSTGITADLPSPILRGSELLLSVLNGVSSSTKPASPTPPHSPERPSSSSSCPAGNSLPNGNEDRAKILTTTSIGNLICFFHFSWEPHRPSPAVAEVGGSCRLVRKKTKYGRFWAKEYEL